MPDETKTRKARASSKQASGSTEQITSTEPTSVKKIDRAWLFFLDTNDYYLYLLLGAYKNLVDTKTKYPVYCAVTKNVSANTKKILNKIGIKVIQIARECNFGDNFNVSKKNMPEHYTKALNKLAILGADFEKIFNKIVYLDTDLQINNNIDELFDKPHMSAVPDQAPGVTIEGRQYKLGSSIFCSGLFVWDFSLNAGKGESIISNLNKLASNVPWHDQSILNYIYSDWITKPELWLSPTYGLMNSDTNFALLGEQPKVVHFVGRLRANWPFNFQQKIPERLWKHTSVNFKDWVISLADTVKFFNKKYKLTIPELHPENLKLMTLKEEQAESAYGQANTYLYF